MDLWVVGAAAAAGYISKHWQNGQKDRDSLSESGTSNHEKHELPSCPIRRILSGKKKRQTEEFSSSVVDRISNVYKLDSVSEADVCSRVYVGKNCNYSDKRSLSSLTIGCSTNDVLEENEDKIGLVSKVCDDSVRICAGPVDFFRDSAKKRSFLRTKYGHSIKPLSSLESCLLAQLYQEHSKMEEYTLSVFPSTPTTTRSLIVTNENQIISRATRGSVSPQIKDEDRRIMEGNVRRVLPPPKGSTLDALDKIKSKILKGPNRRLKSLYKAGSGRPFHFQHGSHDQTFLFCLGISVGIIASLLSIGREIGKLNDQLKQRENFVQDLQEELEMKDSLTVEELADENSESHEDTCDKRNTSTNYNGKESEYEKADEVSEDMSKIESELEAELERLGLNISASVQEANLSDLVELDPDFIVEFAQGELREDMVNGPAVAQGKSDHDASYPWRTPAGNYAVSPRELSLRLHEVIGSRLEEHVKKLEQALQNTQRKARLMESQHKSVQRKLSGSKLRYSSGEGSPISEEDFKFNPMAQPLVMNLSGDALDSYNEAYEELMKANESEEDGSSTFHTETREPLTAIYAQSLTENSQAIQELLYDSTREDQNSNSNDDLYLINQIVEKTRKGSSFVFQAQKLLFSIDEIEH